MVTDTEWIREKSPKSSFHQRCSDDRQVDAQVEASPSTASCAAAALDDQSTEDWLAALAAVVVEPEESVAAMATAVWLLAKFNHSPLFVLKKTVAN